MTNQVRTSSTLLYICQSPALRLFCSPDLDSISNCSLDVEFYAHFLRWFCVPQPSHVFYNVLLSLFFSQSKSVQIWSGPKTGEELARSGRKLESQRGHSSNVLEHIETDVGDRSLEGRLADGVDPVVTDELNPSLRNKVFRLIRDFVLFPTRTRVVAAVVVVLWLMYCASMITFGLTNDHYCPAEPRLSGSIALHGVFWVMTCCYVIIRLIWTEISTHKQPSCRFSVGNPEMKLNWPRELTYVIDAVVAVFLITSYVYNAVAVMRLLFNKPQLVSSDHRDWVRKFFED